MTDAALGVPDLDPVAHNRRAWDRQVEEGSEWTVPFDAATVERARAGDLSSLVLVGHEPVPTSWLPADLRGVEVLCLASGGGQQSALLAAAGASVTVFDNSPRQLERDREVAAREGLDVRTVLGDMRDLGAFGEGSFDLVFNPVSNVFCPDLPPVWRECFRVLRPGGSLLAGFVNPDVFLFEADEVGRLVVRHPLPYSDLGSLSGHERERRISSGVPLEHSHTLALQVGGQIAAGFLIDGFEEAPMHEGPTAEYMAGYFATRAVKPG